MEGTGTISSNGTAPDHVDIRSGALESLPASASRRWAWAVRYLEPERTYRVWTDFSGTPVAGDVALAEVKRIRKHTQLMTARDGRVRLYRGDLLVGVFGNRYATDAFEGEIISTADLYLLTGAGMVGTVRSVHRQSKPPTKLIFRGLLVDEYQRVVNLKARLFPSPSQIVSPVPSNLVLLIGSGMDTGKTTVAAQLVHALSARGLSVAACKLTGSVSHQDQTELRSAVACQVRDFSDYGFPSTYLCSREELLDLFHIMLADVERTGPDVVVMEIADGILQRETDMLLREQALRERSLGVVFTAACASSALYGLARLHALNHRVLAVSGVLTNSPLYMRELQSHSSVPVRRSFGDGPELAEVILRRLRAEPSAAA